MSQTLPADLITLCSNSETPWGSAEGSQKDQTVTNHQIQDEEEKRRGLLSGKLSAHGQMSQCAM